MKSILSLDYELFFGKEVGTPKACLIEATNKLTSTLDKFGAKAVFFVDVTYLLALKRESCAYPCLHDDYLSVVEHIQKLESQGHQIQLHIHPHWMSSEFKNDSWVTTTDRYRLVDWSKREAAEIIKLSVDELNSHLVNDVFTFRAGGWCIQPFDHIANSLYNCGIVLDSSVYKKGRAKSSSHSFDFTRTPSGGSWAFDLDPCVMDSNGRFLEIPISSMRVSPLFYWKFALTKLFGNKPEHGCFGDGSSISNSKKDLLRMMSVYSNSVVSIDGFKSSLLVEQYNKALKRGDEYFVVIGHPKALSHFSIKNIECWLSCMEGNGHSLSLFTKP